MNFNLIAAIYAGTVAIITYRNIPKWVTILLCVLVALNLTFLF